MNLVDEQDGVLLLVQRIEHLLDALFEVTAVARAGHERAHVEREDLRGAQRLGHVALVDPQRQAFGERGLADARLADEQRVVLAPAAEHLDHPLELELPANQRIDAALRRLGDQIRGVGLERIAHAGFAAIRRAGRGRLFRPAVRNRAEQREAIQALLAQEVGGVALLFLQQEHQQGAAFDLLGARRGGVHDGALDDAVEAERRFRLHRLASGHGREGAIEHFLEVGPQHRQVDAAARQDLARLRILDQGVQHVLEADEVVAAIGGDAERAPDAFERVGGKRHRRAAHAPASWGSGSSVTSRGNSCCSAS